MWERQAAVLGFDARALVAEAASMAADPTREAGETVRDSGKAQATTEAGEREAPGAAGLETAVACQSAFNIDPNRRAKLTPLSDTAEVVPVVNRGDPRGFV